MPNDIKPFFESTLAQEARLPGSDITHPVGARVVMIAELATKRFGTILFTTPNATDAFLYEAKELVDKCEYLVNKLDKESPKYTVWSALSSIPGMTAERALREDPSARKLRHANDDLFYRLIVKAGELLFVLIAGVEAMVNAGIPPDYAHQLTNKKGEVVVIDRATFEMNTRLEEKLAILAVQKGLPPPKQQKWWSQFKEILGLRNDIVHLKTKGEVFKTHNAVYTELIDLDFKSALRTIREVISYFS